RAAAAYEPIVSRAHETVVLTGRDLTLDQIIEVAREGAPVHLSPEAQQRQAANFGLLLEAGAEDVPVYWFNRGAGDQRETVLFSGDPTLPRNKVAIEERQQRWFRRGATWGLAPEVDREEVVRAMMLVRANTMSWNAPSPQLSHLLLDLLNQRITPVVQSRGTIGEGDLAQLGNIGAAMMGLGEVYFRGQRMSAEKALRLAGLKPLQPFGADDNALTSSNAYATAQAALVVHDAQRALQWADLIYAMDLNGMDSSVTPLSLVVQCDRPDGWLNWDARQVLSMLRGSYLFETDPARIIQDPESLRASSIRQGSAWREWSALRAAVLAQVNSSDHNPAVRAGIGPEESWELATPQMMRFYVKGGALSHGQHGYIVSNANWDPYPMANELENLVIALGNLDIAVMSRIERFTSPFFTVVKAETVLPAAAGRFNGYSIVALQQEMQSLMSPVAPAGSAIVGTVEDLQAQTLIKVEHARRATDITTELLAHDLLNASIWMDVRKAQDGHREFGAGPTAAWRAFREVLPLRPVTEEPVSEPLIATRFIREHDAATFDSVSVPERTPENVLADHCRQ
ncbi:MAG: aromatic amino acid lyase, partial [Sinobacteraceae bacterium]|nr:aromatic amino acid lyase [Nevskiaceae bacterium]